MDTEKKNSCLRLICSAINLLFVENGEFKISQTLLCRTFLVYLLHDISFYEVYIENQFHVSEDAFILLLILKGEDPPGPSC